MAGRLIAKLHEAEVATARGKQIAEVAKKIGFTEQTYCRCKKEHGGLRMDRTKRLKNQQ